MKKIITLLFLGVCISSLYSQTNLSFCTYVESNGYCIFSNNKFITSPDSTTGRIYMEVKSSAALGAKLTYKIFTVGKNAEEKLSQSLDQNIQPDWFMAWEPYSFPTGAKYSIKVYDETNQIICTNSFELIAADK